MMGIRLKEARFELLKFVLGFEAEEHKTKRKQFIPESHCNVLFYCPQPWSAKYEF